MTGIKRWLAAKPEHIATNRRSCAFFVGICFPGYAKLQCKQTAAFYKRCAVKVHTSWTGDLVTGGFTFQRSQHVFISSVQLKWWRKNKYWSMHINCWFPGAHHSSYDNSYGADKHGAGHYGNKHSSEKAGHSAHGNHHNSHYGKHSDEDYSNKKSEVRYRRKTQGRGIWIFCSGPPLKIMGIVLHFVCPSVRPTLSHCPSFMSDYTYVTAPWRKVHLNTGT